jgi:hypothetical protein
MDSNYSMKIESLHGDPTSSVALRKSSLCILQPYLASGAGNAIGLAGALFFSFCWWEVGI